MSADDERCARCGDVAVGFAYVDGERYCHDGGIDSSPTCYERAVLMARIALLIHVTHADN